MDESTKYSGRNRRRVFRLHLPENSRLKATINGKHYEVVEVAEYSLVLHTKLPLKSDGRFEGAIEWGDETQTNFTGEVGPFHENQRLVIWKIKGISMPNVISEQRRLLRKLSIPLDQQKAG